MNAAEEFYTCIIQGPKFLPPSLRWNINQFNALYGDKPNKSPQEGDSKPSESH